MQTEHCTNQRKRRNPIEMMQADRYIQKNYGLVDVSDMARHLNANEAWVHNRAFLLEVSSTPESKAVVKDLESQEQIYALSQEGVSDFEIAIKFDARVSDIRRVISAMGAELCN